MRLVISLLSAALVFPAAAVQPGERTLSVEERVAAQRAIEQVFWKHRIWPKDNPSPKPQLAAVLSEATLRARVEDTLRKSNALNDLAGRPLTHEYLRAELRRMAESSRQPEVLRELFEALGNDGGLIAETLVRGQLADRLLRQWYAGSKVDHQGVRAAAEAALATASSNADLTALAPHRSTVNWRPRPTGGGVPHLGVPTSARELDPAEWSRFVIELASEFGLRPNASGAADIDGLLAQLPRIRISNLIEREDDFQVVSVVRADASELTVSTWSWPKVPFETYWGVASSTFRASLPDVTTSEPAPQVTAPECPDDSWTPTAASPEDRVGHASVWTGSEMILWGGSADNGDPGYRYDPVLDNWRPISRSGEPSERRYPTGVWTGTRMLVWGGYDRTGNPLGTGAAYDPATDTWTPIATAGAPSPRWEHTSVWTGSRMIVWGGQEKDGSKLGTGASYDPIADTWAELPTAGAPSARSAHATVWTGTAMIVWGGSGPPDGNLGDGARYDPASDVWSPVTLTNAPYPRSYHTGVWTGSEMLVWSGWEPGGRYDPAADSWTPMSTLGSPNFNDHRAVWTGSRMVVWKGSYGGAQYDPVSDEWTPVSTVGAPDARYDFTMVWTGNEAVVWGGYTESITGARYDPVEDAWAGMSAGAPSRRSEHTAVWTGSELLIWGGTGTSFYSLGAGARYTPATDSWSPMAGEWGGAHWHSAIWTGREMIIWGGYFDGGEYYLDDGRAYNPTANSWRTTAQMPGYPGRAAHTAVWTGSEMIIWGGSGYPQWTVFNTGYRYDPDADTWTPVSSVGAPTARFWHSAVWTGSEMIVWGGGTNTGGRYSPSTDTWQPTSTAVGVPSSRDSHVTVWTGTEMIVWGGVSGTSYLATGARYRPSTDSWLPISTVGAPSGRVQLSGDWTGSELIVWGGRNGTAMVGDGGRYSPAYDAWRATSSVVAPSARYSHTGNWSDGQFVVWGGSNPAYTNTGGVYCARCDSPQNWFSDADNDGHGTGAVIVTTCDGGAPTGFAAAPDDCDDTDASVNPMAGERCDGSDDNCNALIDEDVLGVDSDNDTVHNACDNCRLAFNPDQLDTDGDYVGNSCDNCSFLPNPGQADLDADQRGDVCDNCVSAYNPFQDDFDADRAGDACDNCVFDWNGTQTDGNHDGQGDLCDLDDGVIYIYVTDRNYREWQGETGYVGWNSYRGSLGVLKATGVYTQVPGSNLAATRDCGLSEPYVFDDFTAAVGDPAFYLTTGIASGGMESGLGTNGAGVPRTNTNPCP